MWLVKSSQVPYLFFENHPDYRTTFTIFFCLASSRFRIFGLAFEELFTTGILGDTNEHAVALLAVCFSSNSFSFDLCAISLMVLPVSLLFSLISLFSLRSSALVGTNILEVAVGKKGGENRRKSKTIPFIAKEHLLGNNETELFLE